jgi:hypothetical protein
MFFFEGSKLKTPSTYGNPKEKRNGPTVHSEKNKGSFYIKTRHRQVDSGGFVVVAQSEACKGHFISIFQKVVQGDSVVS